MNGKQQSVKFMKKLIDYNANRGKISSETRQRLRDSHKGNTSHLGHKLSPEQKKRVSEGTRRAMSDEFVREYLSLATSGENNHNWLGDSIVRRYSSIFNKWLKDKIRKRDKHTCQLCGVNQKDYTRNLAVHHIDYDKTNNSCINLITLCCECNCRVNFNRWYWTLYFNSLISFDIWKNRHNHKYFTLEDIRNINGKLDPREKKPVVRSRGKEIKKHNVCALV
jgi:hypothetical protein